MWCDVSPAWFGPPCTAAERGPVSELASAAPLAEIFTLTGPGDGDEQLIFQTANTRGQWAASLSQNTGEASSIQ